MTPHLRETQWDNAGMQTSAWSIDCGDITWSNWEWHYRWHYRMIQSSTVLKPQADTSKKKNLEKNLSYLVYFICLHLKDWKFFYCRNVFSFPVGVYLFAKQIRQGLLSDYTHSLSRPKRSPPLLSKHFPPLNLPSLVWLSNTHIPTTPRVYCIWNFISSWEQNLCQS